MFWGNASISKVDTKINWSQSGSTVYERVNDGSDSVWVSSGGRKNTVCTDTHYRIYAPSAGYLRDRPVRAARHGPARARALSGPA